MLKSNEEVFLVICNMPSVLLIPSYVYGYASYIEFSPDEGNNCTFAESLV